MAEIISVVDERDSAIGNIDIDEAHKKGALHRETGVFIANKYGILLQLRKDNSLWDTSSAGHFSEDEDYLQGAIRELKEELGIVAGAEELKEIYYGRRESRNKDINIRFLKIFLLSKDIPLAEFKVQEEEVKEVKYFTKNELIKIMQSKENTLTSTCKNLLEKEIFRHLPITRK